MICNDSIDFLDDDVAVLLASYSVGPDAMRITGMDDRDVVEMIIRQIAEMFTKTYLEVRSQVMDWVVKRWGTDPYALGAFAVAMPGEVTHLT